jgi:hypothetical protein
MALRLVVEIGLSLVVGIGIQVTSHSEQVLRGPTPRA